MVNQWLKLPRTIWLSRCVQSKVSVNCETEITLLPTAVGTKAGVICFRFIRSNCHRKIIKIFPPVNFLDNTYSFSCASDSQNNTIPLDLSPLWKELVKRMYIQSYIYPTKQNRKIACAAKAKHRFPILRVSLLSSQLDLRTRRISGQLNVICSFVSCVNWTVRAGLHHGRARNLNCKMFRLNVGSIEPRQKRRLTGVLWLLQLYKQLHCLPSVSIQRNMFTQIKSFSTVLFSIALIVSHAAAASNVLAPPFLTTY